MLDPPDSVASLHLLRVKPEIKMIDTPDSYLEIVGLAS
jgi:hypothetical protein